MSYRLSTVIDDGLIDKLRGLAGGERKIGAYLSQLIASLPDDGAIAVPANDDLLLNDTATLAAFVALGREISTLRIELQHARMRAYYYQQQCEGIAEQEPIL